MDWDGCFARMQDVAELIRLKYNAYFVQHPIPGLVRNLPARIGAGTEVDRQFMRSMHSVPTVLQADARSQ